MDSGKIYIPVIALAIGGVVKTILNIILISNPAINIYGATISSIVCQGLSFVICMIALNKHIKMKISFKNHIVKPVLASGIMGVVVIYTYNFISQYKGNSISTIVSMIVGVIVYAMAVLLSKCLSREEFHMIPFGTKMYEIFVKIGLYKEA